MGCLTVLKSKKKKTELTVHMKYVNSQKNMATTLPEPQATRRSIQSAPASFRTRDMPTQPISQVTNNNSRMRALSAPSSLDASEQDALVSVECDEQEELKHHVKVQQSPSPQPLPLPSHQTPSVLKTTGSFNYGTVSGPLCSSGPLPLPPSRSLRNFSFEEIVAACYNFSPDRCISEGISSMIYMASFGNDLSGLKQLEATVTRFHQSTQTLKEFTTEVNTLASLQHPNLCKLHGFHARKGSEQRMLVYERLHNGSLEKLLFGRSDGPPLNWNTRMKVALCAAKGLAFLHEEGPFQAMYNEFSTANIQIDKDFSAKLSGYGCVNSTDISNCSSSSSSSALASLSVETRMRGLITPKSNVWSFGIVLLELLTGRKNLDRRYPKEERNLVKWSLPFLTDECRLSLIMDSQLKGRFPAKAARTVADVAQRCLQTEPSERPTMRVIVEHLKVIQDMKHSCRFPLQEPAGIPNKLISRSPSLNGIITHAPRLSFSPSPPPVAPIQLLILSGSLQRPACSTSLSLEELEQRENRRLSSSSSSLRRSSIEGF